MWIKERTNNIALWLMWLLLRMLVCWFCWYKSFFSFVYQPTSFWLCISMHNLTTMCISMHNLTTFSVYKKLFSSTAAKSHEDHDIFDSRQRNCAVPTNYNTSKASFTLSEPHASKADHRGNKCISSHSFPKSVDTQSGQCHRYSPCRRWWLL